MHRAAWIVVIAAACGPSAAEVRTAQHTAYDAEPQVILKAAMQAAEDEHYQIAEVDQANATFTTVPKYFTKEGGARTAGAGNWVLIGDRGVSLVMIVTVTGGTPPVSVDVTPRTFQVMEGSPQPRELKPDDPNLPGFVTGRVEQLSLAIYERAKPYAVASPAAK